MASSIIKSIAMFQDTIDEAGVSLIADDIPKKPVKRLLKLFDTVADKRLEGKISYPLPEILLLAFFAILAGAKTWVDLETFGNLKLKWLRRFLPLENGIPSHDTFRRVFALVDPEALQKATVSFLIDNMKIIKKAFKLENKEGLLQYCVDGKEAKGTGRDPGGKDRCVRNLQTLHIYDLSNAICLVSKAIREKSNEIPAAQEALASMQLKGVVVSFDAMNTQRKTVAVIAEKKGDYVGALKGNQEGFFEEMDSYFTDNRLNRIREKNVTFYETKEKAHNCIETRRYYLTKNVDWFYDIDAWAKLKSFVCCVRTSQNINTGKVISDKSFYISSITNVETCADAIRGHWGVENNLHWHLDVNFDEDYNMTADRNAFQNFSLMNKLSLSLAKLSSKILKTSVRSTRFLTGLDIGLALKTLCVIDERCLASALLNVPQRK